MKLHILSDLRNECLRDAAVPTSHPWAGCIPHTDADVIVLAGEIDTGLQGAEWMIGEADRLGKPVYVLGNHEFYGEEYFALKRAIGARLKDTAVHLLDCGCFEQDGVRILGATLWTDYRLDGHIPGHISWDLTMFYASRQLADHSMIHYQPADTCLRFQPLDALACITGNGTG